MMEFNSWLFDKKVHGVNVSVDISIGDYWAVAQHVLSNNEFQRSRVSSRGKPYQLLRRDLIDGCVMPPIILALKQDRGARVADVVDAIDGGVIDSASRRTISRIIQEGVRHQDFLILDGLQRTYTLGECLATLRDQPEELERFSKRLIRLEVYVGLNKTGILYRMLTLNTGQTPMSFRHQIEMLYRDHLDDDPLADGIVVLREVEERRARGAAKYKFSEVVDMYYAFSTGRAESIDRQTLVNQLGELDFLENYDGSSSDLQSLLICYNLFVRKIELESGDWVFDLEALNADLPDAIVERPFGRNIASVFERVQSMTAFGAEVKRLLKQGQITGFDQLRDVINGCRFTSDPSNSLNMLVLMLDDIAKKATKIGPAQRELFQYSFRALLNAESEAYQDLSSCWSVGQRRFESLNDD
ncbi:MAG: hypothetical protein ACOH1P_10975 [Lysobacter sp.]